jgi:Protein of unknown function (DUF1826)
MRINLLWYRNRANGYQPFITSCYCCYRLRIIKMMILCAVLGLFRFAPPRGGQQRQQQVVGVVTGLSTTARTSTAVPGVGPAAAAVRMMLSGDWNTAKRALQQPDCCVVKVSGLDRHLRALQNELVDHGLVDVDLRSRIRGAAAASSSSLVVEDEGNPDVCSQDCCRVLESVGNVLDNDNDQKKDEKRDLFGSAATIAALEELARGMASLAPDGRDIQDVHVRIVSASNYRAVDPMFHTDKCPLRGYVTLRGVGTEYMTRPCSPWEYLTLRSLGRPRGDSEPAVSVRESQELEFIVMKGDYYPHPEANNWRWSNVFWQRAYACVHRSPPGQGGRRVIISLDLADGDDDREWYDAGHKREWRSGMTQRKSRLVA